MEQKKKKFFETLQTESVQGNKLVEYYATVKRHLIEENFYNIAVMHALFYEVGCQVIKKHQAAKSMCD